MSFKVSNYPLHLSAKLEVLSSDGAWQHLRTVDLRDKPYRFLLSPGADFLAVRLRLCLESNALLCGSYSEASVVDRIQEAALFTEDGQAWLLAVVVGVLVSSLVILILLIKCCCKGGLRKTSGKEEVLKNRPDILHPSLSFDNKIAESGAEYLERRASLHSQDSLWHVKEEAAAYAEGGADQPADYAHYPRPEEYLGEGGLWPGSATLLPRGRPEGGELHLPPEQYMAGHAGDQYALPSKMRGRGQQQEEYSHGEQGGEAALVDTLGQ